MRFNNLTISSLAAAALGIGLAVTFTQTPSRAQQAKGKAEPLPVVIPQLANYPLVTQERLTKPTDGDWLMIRRTYDGWGYSPLSQINVGNVSKLKLVWTSNTGEVRPHEAAPLVNGNAMFVPTAERTVDCLRSEDRQHPVAIPQESHARFGCVARQPPRRSAIRRQSFLRDGGGGTGRHRRADRSCCLEHHRRRHTRLATTRPWLR